MNRYPTKEERKTQKAVFKGMKGVQEAVQRSVARAEQVGGPEYLAQIAADAYLLAQEVQILRQANAHLAEKNNSLLRLMQDQPEYTPSIPRIWPARLV